MNEHTISTTLYDYLYVDWLERFETEVTLKLALDEVRRAAFYAGMAAALNLEAK